MMMEFTFTMQCYKGYSMMEFTMHCYYDTTLPLFYILLTEF